MTMYPLSIVGTAKHDLSKCGVDDVLVFDARNNGRTCRLCVVTKKTPSKVHTELFTADLAGKVQGDDSAVLRLPRPGEVSEFKRFSRTGLLVTFEYETLNQKSVRALADKLRTYANTPPPKNDIKFLERYDYTMLSLKELREMEVMLQAAIASRNSFRDMCARGKKVKPKTDILQAPPTSTPVLGKPKPRWKVEDDSDCDAAPRKFKKQAASSSGWFRKRSIDE